MKTKKTETRKAELISLNAEIMECFNSDAEFAVIRGGSKVGDLLRSIDRAINIINCGCTRTNNCNC